MAYRKTTHNLDTWTGAIFGFVGFFAGVALLLWLVFSPAFLEWFQALPKETQVGIGFAVMALPLTCAYLLGTVFGGGKRR